MPIKKIKNLLATKLVEWRSYLDPCAFSGLCDCEFLGDCTATRVHPKAWPVTNLVDDKFKRLKAAWDALNSFCQPCGVTGDCHCEFLDDWSDPEIVPAQQKTQQQTN